MNPAESTKLSQNREKLTYDDFRIGRVHGEQKARIAELRDAFLWIFARYGFFAIANPWMDWARKTILTGKADPPCKWAICVDNDFLLGMQERLGGPFIAWLSRPANAFLVCRDASVHRPDLMS